MQDLIEKYSSEFDSILAKIEKLLTTNQNYGQANVIKNLIQHLKEHDYLKFNELITSVNMWGGSGAVWEVYFENRKLQTEFHIYIGELMNILQIADISSQRIDSLKDYFLNKKALNSTYNNSLAKLAGNFLRLFKLPKKST